MNFHKITLKGYDWKKVKVLEDKLAKNELTLEQFNEEKEKCLEEKEYKFRLLASQCEEIEKTTGITLINYLKEESVTMIVTLLHYMCKSTDATFSKLEAQRLYDNLVDNGWIFKKILNDIIYETMVISGFLEKEEWEKTTKRAMELEKIQDQTLTNMIEQKKKDLQAK